MAIARYPGFVIDCPAPVALATFYADLLGWWGNEDDGEWVDIRSEDGTNRLSFQRVPDLRVTGCRAPERPGRPVRQQAHPGP